MYICTNRDKVYKVSRFRRTYPEKTDALGNHKRPLQQATQSFIRFLASYFIALHCLYLNGLNYYHLFSIYDKSQSCLTDADVACSSLTVTTQVRYPASACKTAMWSPSRTGELLPATLVSYHKLCSQTRTSVPTRMNCISCIIYCVLVK